jgi:hypothetical protein
MKVKSLKELNFLLSLYTVKSTTLRRMCELGGFNFRSGKMTELRCRLMKEEILEEDGFVHKPRAAFVRTYRINHKRLDDIIVTKTPIWHIYKRTRDGPISVIPLKKPDKEKMKEWMEG